MTPIRTEERAAWAKLRTCIKIRAFGGDVGHEMDQVWKAFRDAVTAPENKERRDQISVDLDEERAEAIVDLIRGEHVRNVVEHAFENVTEGAQTLARGLQTLCLLSDEATDALRHIGVTTTSPALRKQALLVLKNEFERVRTRQNGV